MWCLCGKHPCNVTTQYMQLLTEQLDFKLVWKITKVIVKLIWDLYVENFPVKFQDEKGQTTVNIKLVHDFNVENITVKIHHDPYNSWGVIVFRSQLNIELVWQ